jgi:hypothetical protein
LRRHFVGDPIIDVAKRREKEGDETRATLGFGQYGKGGRNAVRRRQHDKLQQKNNYCSLFHALCHRLSRPNTQQFRHFSGVSDQTFEAFSAICDGKREAGFG